MSVGIERLVRRGHRKLRVYEQYCAAVSIWCIHSNTCCVFELLQICALGDQVWTRPALIPVVGLLYIHKCVCCHPSCSGRTGGTSHRISPPTLIFSREGFSRPFPSSTAKSNFLYPRNNRSPLVGHDVRKNPTSCDRAEIRTHVPTSEGFEVAN